MPEQEFGSDGQVHPIAPLPDAPPAAAEKPVGSVDPFEASEPASAAQRLRAFEDEHLGPDAVRIGGHVEKGHGSAFKSLSPAHHGHYAALEKLVDAETKLGVATSAQAQAQAAYDAAKAHAESSAVRSESEQGA